MSHFRPRVGFLPGMEHARREGLNQAPEGGIHDTGLRREAAAARLVEALREFVEACQSSKSSADDWVSQECSPLGRKKHLEAVRTGILPGARVGRKVLIRRRDIDAFLEKREGAPDLVHRETVRLLDSLGLEVRRA